MVPVADVVLASAVSLWFTLFQLIMAASVRLGRCLRHAPVYGCFLEEFLVHCARAVRTYFRVLVSGSHCSACLGVADEYENWILRETTLFVGAMLGSTVDTCSASVLWLWTYFTHFLRCGRLES